MRAKKVLNLLSVCLALCACDPQSPIRIGFVGGLSDRNSDVGQSGLNAVQLAVEQVNRTGGIGGRMVELVSRDDAQNREIAERAARELVAEQVVGVIGPFTSSMAEVAVPIFGRNNIFQISPTVTSMAFYGKDDNLFRINRTTRDNARDYANVLIRRGQRRIAVAYDLRNRNFTESWLGEFRAALQARGAVVSGITPYESSADTAFSNIVENMLNSSPDSLFFISGAVDVARLAREARKKAPQLPIAASEWAATEQLIKLGGSVIDGLLIVLNYDKEDISPRFLDFVEAYQQRYQRPPGYSAVAAYDAAIVMFAALKAQGPGESLKMAALRAGPYQGLQQEIVFDKNGDTERKILFTEVHRGHFMQTSQ